MGWEFKLFLGRAQGRPPQQRAAEVDHGRLVAFQEWIATQPVLAWHHCRSDNRLCGSSFAFRLVTSSLVAGEGRAGSSWCHDRRMSAGIASTQDILPPQRRRGSPSTELWIGFWKAAQDPRCHGSFSFSRPSSCTLFHTQWTWLEKLQIFRRYEEETPCRRARQKESGRQGFLDQVHPLRPPQVVVVGQPAVCRRRSRESHGR